MQRKGAEKGNQYHGGSERVELRGQIKGFEINDEEKGQI